MAVNHVPIIPFLLLGLLLVHANLVMFTHLPQAHSAYGVAQKTNILYLLMRLVLHLPALLALITPSLPLELVVWSAVNAKLVSLALLRAP